MDRDAKDLIDQLLAYNPEKRLGFKNFHSLKTHPFFNGIDFKMLENKESPVPNLELFGVTS